MNARSSGFPRGLIALTLVCSCAKSRADTTAASSTEDTREPAPPPSRPVPAQPPGTWQGTYQSSPGVLYIPPDWKDVRGKVKETSGGLGPGTIEIQIDSTTGRILGTLAGPLGPATIDGLASDGKLTATIARRNPADEGFDGTMVGAIAKDRADGTISVALPTASAIRSATFSLSAAGASKAPR